MNNEQNQNKRVSKATPTSYTHLDDVPKIVKELRVAKELLQSAKILSGKGRRWAR